MNASFYYQTKILPEHLDMFDHVNNAAYLTLYEEARWDFIVKNGYGPEKIAETEKGPVILELHLNFYRELLLDEVIDITSQVIDISKNKIVTLQQIMKKKNDELASKLQLKIGFMDLQKRRLIELATDWLRAIGVS